MDFAFLSVVELGRLLRQKKTSATELATYFLDRLERLGPKFNAVVTITRERGRGSGGGRSRDPGGEMARSTARDSVRREGSARDQGLSDDVGGRAVSTAEVRQRRDGHRAPRCGGRCIGREARHGRARWWDGLQPGERVLHRAGQDPVESRLLERRVVERAGCRGRGRS